MRPDLGYVKESASKGFGLAGFHDLNEEFPYRKLASVNGVPEVLVVVIGIGTGNLLCFLGRGEVRDALFRSEMELAVSEVSVTVH